MIENSKPYMKLRMCQCRHCRAGRSGKKSWGGTLIQSNKKGYRNEFSRLLRTLTIEKLEDEATLPLGRGSLYTD